MKLSDFDYELPKELVAQEALDDRSRARMMVLQEAGGFLHRQIGDLTDCLGDGDVLVFNNTRVLPARLKGRKSSGGKVDALVLNNAMGAGTTIVAGATAEPGAQVATELAANSALREVLLRGSNILEGSTITFDSIVSDTEKIQTEVLRAEVLRAKVLRRLRGAHYLLEFDRPEWIERVGEMPIPPYIKTKLVDQERYQTVYSKEKGSLAAPTAGLHFTAELLEKLRAKGVRFAFVTLHVGIGTFETIRSATVEDWKMHQEFCSVSEENAAVINAAIVEKRRIFPVGTTSVRTLESVIENARVRAIEKWTDIFIYPGYQFKCAYAGLLTNFHLPESTLLLLVCALAGKDKIFAAYAEAVRSGYRFYSLGDAMLILL